MSSVGSGPEVSSGGNSSEMLISLGGTPSSSSSKKKSSSRKSAGEPSSRSKKNRSSHGKKKQSRIIYETIGEEDVGALAEELGVGSADDMRPRSASSSSAETPEEDLESPSDLESTSVEATPRRTTGRGDSSRSIRSKFSTPPVALGDLKLGGAPTPRSSGRSPRPSGRRASLLVRKDDDSVQRSESMRSFETGSFGSSRRDYAESTALLPMIELLADKSDERSSEFADVSASFQDLPQEEVVRRAAAATSLASRFVTLSAYPYIIMTPDCIVQMASENISGLLGYDSDDIVGRNVNMLMPERLALKHDSIVAAYIRSVQRRERRVSSVVGNTRPILARTKDGALKPIILTVRSINADASRGNQAARGARRVSEPILFIAQLRDATEEISLRQALQEAKLLEDSFPFPYIETDERGTIRKFNPAAADSFGITRNVAIGKNVCILMPERLKMISSGRSEKRSSHVRILRNYVQKVKDVGRENTVSNIVGCKTHHTAARTNMEDEFSVKPQPFDIELEVFMSLNARGDISFRAFVRDVSAFMNEDEVQDRLVHQVFPKPVAKRYLAGKPVNGTQDVTAIFCDIVGFTRVLDMMEDDATVQILNDLWGRFTRIEEEVDGFYPIKTNYDEFMAVCGLQWDDGDNRGHVNHAEVAVAAAHLMMEAVMDHNAEFNNSISVRVGISSGDAILCVVETPNLAFDVLGETTVFAARSESSGIPNRIQITQHTYTRLSESAKSKFERRKVPVTFKNIGEVPTYLSFPLVDE